MKKEFKKNKAVNQKWQQIMDDYHSGDKAREMKAKEEALKNMKGFIIQIIRKTFLDYSKEYGEDLLQEGYFGVLQALKKYDPNKANPTTFFNVYIRHEIYKFITEQAKKTTAHYTNKIKKIEEAKRELEAKGIPCECANLAIATGFTTETIMQATRIQIASNEKYIEEDEGNVIDEQCSQYFKSPEETYLEKEEVDALHNALKTLNEKELQVILLIYYQQKSLAEVAKQIGVPVETVRRLKQSAILNLRNRTSLKATFYDNIEKDKAMIEYGEIPTTPKKVAEDTMDALMQSFTSDNEMLEVSFS